MTIIHYEDLDQDLLNDFDLRHINEDDLTISRCKKGKGFCFYAGDGTLLSDNDEKDRLLKIAVPPAYTDVLYAPFKNAHIQAVGHDSSRKKQYFYHEEWEILRNVTKFTSLYDFGLKLPSFRRKLSKALDDDHNPKAQVIAAMFRILDKTGMRVGGTKSAKSNHTYGLTTLKANHVDLDNDTIELSYTGKGGVDIKRAIRDKKIIHILEQCSDLSGHQLFKHKKGIITSDHINTTIKNHFGKSYSAKDFRTWRFSSLFLKKIVKQRDNDKIILKEILDDMSELTGNTPSVLQSSYIHPGLIKIAKDHDFNHLDYDGAGKSGLRQNEALFLNYLQTKHAKQSLRD